VPASLCRRIIALSPGNFHQYFIRGWDEGGATTTDGSTPSYGKLVLLPNCTDAKAPSKESVQAWRSQWGWGQRLADLESGLRFQEDQGNRNSSHENKSPESGPAAVVHVVSLGRLVPQKRMDWLMRAWALRGQPVSVPVSAPGSGSESQSASESLRSVTEGVATSQSNAAHLWIVGGGDLHRYRELAQQLGIQNTCTLTGFDPEGWKRLAAADIFALTSRSEGLPFVVLEAMAAGVPTVASRVDGIEGTVRDGLDGLLVLPTDLRAFADALDKLIASASLRAQMGASARERSREYECRVV
jgi:glycosyltransferase involved in cell wall biosynthesis